MSHQIYRRPAPGTRVRRRAVVLLAGSALSVGLLVSGCSATAPSSTGATGPTAQVTPAPSAPSDSGPTEAAVTAIALSPRLDHAHGLLVAADGALLAGTHSGVAAIALDGAVSPVGDGADDLMGMTGIPGTARLASSGHPGAGSDLPNPLGLITSEDGGVTWDAVSLTGEVDFHALATDGTRVVGFDGRAGLLVSDDGGRTFDDGARIAPAALAITPDGVWATTADGVQRSTDGGLTFAVVDGAPLLVLLAAGSDGSLWGVAPDGAAWRSGDGTAWDRRGVVGEVEAIAVADHDRAYAVTADTLYVLD